MKRRHSDEDETETSNKRHCKEGRRRQRYSIPQFDVSDVTMDGAGVPMRLMLRNVSATFPDWPARREELLAKYANIDGIEFGAHVAAAAGEQRRLIPLVPDDLTGIVTGRSFDAVVMSDVLPHIQNRGKPPYCLISASIFVDPPRSARQHHHEDVHGYDRHQVWNIIMPIRVPTNVPRDVDVVMQRDEVQGIARARQNADDAIMWDGSWMHRGVGNASDSESRIMLHLVFVPLWMTVNAKTRALLAVEYNNGCDLDDDASPVGQWMRVRWSGVSDAQQADIRADADVF